MIWRVSTKESSVETAAEGICPAPRAFLRIAKTTLSFINDVILRSAKGSKLMERHRIVRTKGEEDIELLEAEPSPDKMAWSRSSEYGAVFALKVL
jgi:hypothetical protein